MVEDLYAWCTHYLDALPPPIRASIEDSRFIAAARRARDNTWHPQHIANLVAAQSYARAYNPPLIALMQLERLAERAPHQRTQPTRNINGCIVCAPNQRCPNPVLPQHRIPPELARERWDLIAEMSRRSDLTEDEREGAMTTLITHQQRSAHGRLPGR